MRMAAAFALLGLLSGCAANQQLRFDAWRGLSPELASGLKSGELPYSKDEVFKAAGDTLEHEPFMHWELRQMDPKEGTISASAAGVLLQMQVLDASGDSLAGRCRLLITLPPQGLAGQKSIWVSKKDALLMTAYDIDFSQREPWQSVEARFQLDQNYLVSAIYRHLADHSAVPFSLEDTQAGKAQKP